MYIKKKNIAIALVLALATSASNHAMDLSDDPVDGRKKQGDADKKQDIVSNLKKDFGLETEESEVSRLKKEFNLENIKIEEHSRISEISEEKAPAVIQNANAIPQNSVSQSDQSLVTPAVSPPQIVVGEIKTEESNLKKIAEESKEQAIYHITDSDINKMTHNKQKLPKTLAGLNEYIKNNGMDKLKKLLLETYPMSSAQIDELEYYYEQSKKYRKEKINILKMTHNRQKLPETLEELNEYIKNNGMDKLKKLLLEKESLTKRLRVPTSSMSSDQRAELKYYYEEIKKYRKEKTNILNCAIESGKIELLKLLYSGNCGHPPRDEEIVEPLMKVMLSADNNEIKNSVISFFSDTENMRIADQIKSNNDQEPTAYNTYHTYGYFFTVISKCFYYASEEEFKKLIDFVSNSSVINNKKELWRTLVEVSIRNFHDGSVKCHGMERFRDNDSNFLEMMSDDFLKILFNKNELNVSENTAKSIFLNCLFGLYRISPSFPNTVKFDKALKGLFRILSKKNLHSEVLNKNLLDLCNNEKDYIVFILKNIYEHIVSKTKDSDCQRILTDLQNVPFSDNVKRLCFDRFVHDFTTYNKTNLDKYILALNVLTFFEFFPLEWYEQSALFE